ncbi:type II toxin-antitoxin system VapC family toxin [Planktothrix mougeotii]|uniref:Type II toxin-antitoxin system VapC family toxin n=1 Tax=Planktothrix mougeotii LEGE 06226 TaxID=1828728 RepID=A0ABR9U966_9CYAN|nr:type II toxin-antitoxin system VapC family toxin [Planktothrix mougeotii]MBE9142992.1 type II toxin-antitoxin system VapC family toxin [Planktothrix mougeotii LEGE 06226]
MAKFVVDANVAIKWVIPEVHTEIALRLLDDDANVLLVPDFFFPEIGNILWKRVRRGDLTLEQAKDSLDELKRMNLQICSSEPLISSALEIATRVNQAVYDCVYLTLAVNHHCSMVTADERFVNATRNDVFSSSICWIEDLP